jgi:hypothetical protein
MKGSAPKSPLMGSHVLVVKKLQPNACRDSVEVFYNCSTRRPVTRRIENAAAKVMRYVTSSPFLKRSRTVYFPGMGG